MAVQVEVRNLDSMIAGLVVIAVVLSVFVVAPLWSMLSELVKINKVLTALEEKKGSE